MKLLSSQVKGAPAGVRSDAAGALGGSFAARASHLWGDERPPLAGRLHALNDLLQPRDGAPVSLRGQTTSWGLCSMDRVSTRLVSLPKRMLGLIFAVDLAHSQMWRTCHSVL